MKKIALNARLPVTASPLVLAVAALITNYASAACPVQIPSTIDSDIPSPNNFDDVVIRKIHISNGDVFDLENPKYDGLLHRFMNAIHVQTDEAVIRQQLLFSEGDSFTENAISETERYLRANRYLAKAEVLQENCENGHVDLQVKTVDSWSLIPSISFSRKGGQNFGGFEIQETNLFGSGSEVKLAYDSDVERDLLALRFVDRQLGGSRTGILIALEDYDNGYRYELSLGQPFYSLNTRRAVGSHVEVFDQLDGIFELGERLVEVRHDGHQIEGHFGWSQGLKSGRVIRWIVGAGYDEHHFLPIVVTPVPRQLPADRQDVYPFVGVEWLENDYEKARNQDQMSRVEDRHVGTRLSLQLGYAATVFGSMENALRLEVAASRGFHPVPGDTLMLSSKFDWRQPSAARASYLLQSDARYYHRQSQEHLFFAQLHVAAGENLDTDRQLTLGGDTGLRGYPVRYLNGDTTALLTLEQRFYTDWYPFHLFRVGAAAFFDAGRVWRYPGQERAFIGILKDAGIGLRIGSPHSATGRMLHVDAAYALDGPAGIRGWQLYIQSHTNF